MAQGQHPARDLQQQTEIKGSHFSHMYLVNSYVSKTLLALGHKGDTWIFLPKWVKKNPAGYEMKKKLKHK